MPDPTTLKAFWEQELSDATDALDATRTELNQALALKAELRTDLNRSLKQVRTRRRQIDELWRQAGAADTPSEGADLMDQIRVEMAALQEDEARTVGLEWELAKAKARADRLGRVRTRQAEAREAAEEEEAQALADEEDRQRWMVAAGSSPRDTVPVEARDYLDGPTYAALETSVEDAIPELLRRSALARVDLERTRRGYARELAGFSLDELQEHWQTAGGVARDAERALLSLHRADAALEGWTSSALSRLTRAVSALDDLQLHIDPAEAAAVADVPADALAAVEAEEAAVDAQKLVEMRRFQLLRSLTQRQVEPTPARKAAVTMAENRLTTAKDARDVAVAALDPLKPVLDEWQTLLSRKTWEAYLTFLEATETLEELEDTDPTVLISDVTAAEAAATSALALAVAADRGVEQWEEFIQEMFARDEASSSGQRRRLIHAVAGDSYIPGLPPMLP